MSLPRTLAKNPLTIYAHLNKRKVYLLSLRAYTSGPGARSGCCTAAAAAPRINLFSRKRANFTTLPMARLRARAHITPPRAGPRKSEAQRAGRGGRKESLISNGRGPLIYENRRKESRARSPPAAAGEFQSRRLGYIKAPARLPSFPTAGLFKGRRERERERAPACRGFGGFIGCTRQDGVSGLVRLRSRWRMMTGWAVRALERGEPSELSCKLMVREHALVALRACRCFLRNLILWCAIVRP